ncbi:MAG TPA: hypothetical protein VLI92_00105 [Candidatus Saccharimonadales bacterium]|nr:hypothetical protein [Candidatus Saccharimonadales bacterium]
MALKVYLNYASRFPWAAYAPDSVIKDALQDGYDGVSGLPVWGEVSHEFLNRVRYVERAWNPGPPWLWAWGKLTHNPRTLLLHDWLFFPWFSFLCESKYDRFALNGAVEIVHDFKSRGIVEVNPNMRVTGLAAVRFAVATNRQLCFDLIHAERNIRPDEGGKEEPSPLGEWHEWLAAGLRQHVVTVFDFHLTPEQASKGDYTRALEAFIFARHKGFKGDIRVEATLPLKEQIFGSRELSQDILKELQPYIK